MDFEPQFYLTICNVGGTVETQNKANAVQIIQQMTNPVEVIVNLLYLIEQERHDPDAVLRFVGIADSQAQRLSSIIKCGSNF